MAVTSTLRFERSVSYRDRAVRYLVEVDGQPLAPRLAALDSVSIIVGPGDHVVRVSVGTRRYFEAVVAVAHGETVAVRAVPGPLLGGGAGWRQPRLMDLATGRLMPGTHGRRTQPVAQPSSAHLRTGSGPARPGPWVVCDVTGEGGVPHSDQGPYRIEVIWKEQVAYWEGPDGFVFTAGWGVEPPDLVVPSESMWDEVVPDWMRGRRDIIVSRLRAASEHTIAEDVHGSYRNSPDSRLLARDNGTADAGEARP